MKFLKHFLLLAIIILISSIGLFSQSIGGRNSGEMTPQKVSPSKLNGNATSSEVNLFNGTFNTSHNLGNVSTPGGLNYNLSLNYTSTYTGGNNITLTSGIPYGEGWSLNIPTISITNEVYTAYARGELCSFDPTDVESTLDQSIYDGDLFWYNPILSIPGVASGQLVFKYFSDGNAVFVLNAFENYIEVHLRGSTWIAYLQDGTMYEFGLVKGGYTNGTNRRLLNANDVINYGVGEKIKLRTSVLPRDQIMSWYCTQIYNPNLPAQQGIRFLYESFGKVNYFNEISADFQPRINEKLSELLLSPSGLPNFPTYSDVLLKEIYSFDYYTILEKLVLNYETINPTGTINMLLLGEDGVKSLDPLYNYKSTFYQGIYDADFSCANDGGMNGGSYTPTSCESQSFNNWKRYYHTKHNAVQNAGLDVVPTATNPYLGPSATGDLSYFSNSISNTSSPVPFDHSFLESPRLQPSQGYKLIPGDLYEVRTVVKGNQFCNIDINLATGINEPISPEFISGIDQIRFIDKKKTSGVSVFSTFNQAVKWNAIGHSVFGGTNIPNKPMFTSNFFSMPNLPDDFNGFHIQVGAANSDNKFNEPLSAINRLVSGSPVPASYKSYFDPSYTDPSHIFNKDAFVPNNFGIGLHWLQMARMYADLDDATIFINNNNVPANRYRFWWKNIYDAFYNSIDNTPTLANEGMTLNAIELIRYSKNPYMLNSVEKYIVNGEFSGTGQEGLVLIKKKGFEYGVETIQLVDNKKYEQGDEVEFSQYNWRNVFYLKTIREYPTNSSENNPPVLSDNEISQLPSTHFDYQVIPPLSTILDTEFKNNGAGILLSKITSPLGGEKFIEYHPISPQNGSYITARYNPNYCAQQGESSNMGASLAVQVYHVVKTVSTLDANFLRERKYFFSNPVTVKMNGNFNSDHFANSSIDFKTGFLNTQVVEPDLGEGQPPYTLYEHFGEITTNDIGEHHLLFGKLKNITQVNSSGNSSRMISYDYSISLAYQNGIYRDKGKLDKGIYDYLLYPGFDPTYGGSDYTDYLVNASPYPNENSDLFQNVGYNSILPKSKYYLSLVENNNILSPIFSNSYFVSLQRKTETTYDFSVNLDDYLNVSKITDYEYYDADYKGLSSSQGYKELLSVSNNEMPIQLYAEPSWKLYKSKTYSNDCPGIFESKEYFYYYDLLNKLIQIDEYGLEKHSLPFSYSSGSSGSVMFTGLQDFCALKKCRELKIRDIVLEERITSKAVNKSPITRSSYYLYDCQWNVPELSQEEVIIDESVVCNQGGGGSTTPPEPGGNNSECEFFKVIGGNLDTSPIPWGHAIVCKAGQPENTYWLCPFGSWDTNDYDLTIYRSNPGSIEESQASNPLFRYQEEFIFKDKLQHRSTWLQIDTVFLEEDYDSHIPILENKNQILDFYSETPGLGELWKFYPEFPYDALKVYDVLERNAHGKVQLEQDEKGLKTKYYYSQVTTKKYLFPNCSQQNYIAVDASNIGLVNKVEVGVDLPDNLITLFDYHIDLSLAAITDPNGLKQDFSYDNYGRLSESFKNDQRLIKYNYSFWKNNFNEDFHSRASRNFVESFAFYNDNSPEALRSRAYSDPLGRNYNNASQYCENADAPSYSNDAAHTGEILYDAWDRTTKSYKNFLFQNNTPVNINPRLHSSNTSEYPDVFSSFKYESDFRSRIIEDTPIDVGLGSIHSRRYNYWYLNGATLINELNLNEEEVDLMFQGGDIDSYIFSQVFAKDEDGKTSISYSNAFGQQIGNVQIINGGENIVTLFIYDSYGNVTKVINPKKQESNYYYNLLGWLYKKESVDAGRHKYMYNKSGQVVLEQTAEMADAVFQILPGIKRPEYRQYQYDGHGRLSKQQRISIDNYTIEMWYNRLDNYLIDPMFYEDTELEIDESSMKYYNYKLVNNSTYDWKATIGVNLNVSQFNIQLVQIPVTNFLKATTLEKEWYYHNSSISDGLTSILHPDLNDFMISGRNNLLGKLSHTLVYGHNQITNYGFQNLYAPILINLYSYNEDGEIETSKEQFNSNGITSNDLGILLQSEYEYNLQGKPTKVFIDNPIEEIDEIETVCSTNFEYDYRGRLETINKYDYPVARYSYDDALGLITSLEYFQNCEKKVIPVDKINYFYDRRDRLVSIASQFFDQNLYYDNNLPNAPGNSFNASNNYNGNINASVAKYKTALSENHPIINKFSHPTYYGYQYDNLNRLTHADATVQNYFYGLYGESLGDVEYQYDKIGNFIEMKRHQQSQNFVFPYYYSYQYPTETNRLEGVDIVYQASRNFNYDASGNLISDDFRQINEIEYGRANLSYKTTVNNNSINYLYNANDARIYKEVNGDEGVLTNWEYYVRDIFGNEVAILKYDDTDTYYLDKYYFGHQRLLKTSYHSNIGVIGNPGTEPIGNPSVPLNGIGLRKISDLKLDNSSKFLIETINKELRKQKEFPLVLEKIVTKKGMAQWQRVPEKIRESLLLPKKVKNRINRKTEYLILSQPTDTIFVTSKIGERYGIRLDEILSLKTSKILDIPIKMPGADEPFDGELDLEIPNDEIAVTRKTNSYYIYDHLGNTRVVYTAIPFCDLITLEDSEVRYVIQNLVDYYPYGKELRSYTLDLQEKYLTTQHERDSETGLDYRMARMYDSELGRFLSVDPLDSEFPLQSSFSALNNNPIFFIDPDGRAADSPDWVEGADGNIKWDENATSLATTQAGETYLGKNVLVGTHNRNASGNEAINTAKFNLYLESDKTGPSATIMGNTVPADNTKAGTLAEGLYSAKFGHRNKKKYQNELALRIYNLDGSDGLPTLNGNPNPESDGKTLTGVLFHMGNNYQTSLFDSNNKAYSTGCQTSGCFPNSRPTHIAFMNKVGRGFKGFYYLRSKPVLTVPTLVPFSSDISGKQ